MAQSTFVLKLTRSDGEALRNALDPAEFEFRTVPHALFSAKGQGCVATLYKSGKLVVQGAEPELFVGRHLPGATGTTAPVAPDAGPAEPGDRDLIGGDESGKGDYFGPLVVAIVRVEASEARALREGGVGDSKKLSAARIETLAGGLESRFPHAVEVLDPPEYNAAHERLGNVNLILCEMYRRAAERVALPGWTVLIDQFSHRQSQLQSAFANMDVALEQEPKAERHMAVAAASILARDVFVRRLSELSDRFGLELRKGAGPPVVESAKEFLRLHGRESLAHVAKLHFATTQRLDTGR